MKLKFCVGVEICECAYRNCMMHPSRYDFIIDNLLCNKKCVKLCHRYSFHLTRGSQPVGISTNGAFQGFMGELGLHIDRLKLFEYRSLTGFGKVIPVVV